MVVRLKDVNSKTISTFVANKFDLKYIAVKRPIMFGNLVVHHLEFHQEEIRRSLKSGLFYSAITVALTLPDICSSLERGPDESNTGRVKERYLVWCETYLVSKFEHLKALDIWALRNGIIHNGQSFGGKDCKFERVVFVLPNGFGKTLQMLSQTGGENGPWALTIGVEFFCEQIIEAALEWYLKASKTEQFEQNIGGLIRFRPSGYGNHIVGVPVIA